jgi:phosphoglycolate phosphatase
MTEFTAVFDLDGTLADSAGDLVHAANHALSTIGVAPVPRPHFETMIGNGARAMLERALATSDRPASKDELDVLLSRFLAFYADNIAVETRAFPGADATLARMHAAGCKLAVCTNKTEHLARKLLCELKLEHYFHAVTGRDTLPVCKPDPGHLIGTIILADGDLHRSVLVGDSETDVKTAKAAGIPVVGVTFGYTATPMTALGADAVISHFDQLEHAIEGLLRDA